MEPVMSDPRILAERDGTILTLTLNRPDKLNAIDGAMLDALDEVLGEIERDREVRAVILTGAGRAFSAGADIKEWTALTPLEFGRSWGLRGHALFDRLAALPPPVIAAINGIAFGGGLELALCADVRIASEQARLGLPEVTIAAMPGWGGTQRLPRLIGPGRAKHMILTGQPIDAARAEAWGLVSEMVAGDALLARARELATQIAANAPLAVQATKRLIDAALPVTPAATLETQAGALCGSTEDAKEGRASFLERRPPRYQGR
jgi:enoyl-CoA hydratase/carnithine racemase